MSMRHVLVASLATCAAVAAAGIPSRPAYAVGTAHRAQPLMVADNGGGGSNLFSLFQQIQQLQQQVRDLQGEVDTLKHRLKRNEQTQSDQYQNLDKRLTAITNGGASSSDTMAGMVGTSGTEAGSDSAAGSQQVNSGTPGGDYGSSSNQGGGSPSSQSGNTAQSNAAVQSAYMDGFNKLQNGKYDAAISAFKAFVSQYPNTSLTDNAWYWLGEAYYVERNYSDSNKAFETVINHFGNSPKVPDSLYKMGLIEADQGNPAKARNTLEQLAKQYPKSNAAGLAQKKLQSLGQ